jgi:hypothetical protein
MNLYIYIYTYVVPYMKVRCVYSYDELNEQKIK